MSDNLNAIIDDLEAEQEALRAVLGALPASDWDAPTHAVGWSVRDQVSHLAYFDEAATRAMLDREAFVAEVQEALQAGGDLETRYLARGREMSPGGLLDWWTVGKPGADRDRARRGPGGTRAVVRPGHEPGVVHHRPPDGDVGARAGHR